MEELEAIMQKFAASGWDLIAVPAQEWLDGKADKDTLVSCLLYTSRNRNDLASVLCIYNVCH